MAIFYYFLKLEETKIRKHERLKEITRNETRALQWGPMNFFPKIPEIDSLRFSFRFPFEVIVAVHEKLEKFQNISVEDLSENCQ